MKKNKSNQDNLPQDYQPVYQYLLRKDWRNADLATRELMLKIVIALHIMITNASRFHLLPEC